MPQPPKINRTEVLQAALQLLEERGEPHLSLRTLAARLHVTPNALYWHYADRDTLVNALAAAGADELRAALERALPVNARTLPDLAPLAEAYLTFARQRPHLYALLMTPRNDPSVKDGLWEGVLNMLSPVVGPEHATETGVALWAYLHGVAGLQALGPFHEGKPDSGLQAGLRALLAHLPG